MNLQLLRIHFIKQPQYNLSQTYHKLITNLSQTYHKLITNLSQKSQTKKTIFSSIYVAFLFSGRRK